jgi:hypothetical protein
MMSVRGQQTKWDKWYSTARWARIRKHQLREHPLCNFAWSAPSLRRRPSAITSSHTMATSTNSGSAHSSHFARNVTTPPSGSSSSTDSAPISAWMDGRSRPAPSGLSGTVIVSLAVSRASPNWATAASHVDAPKSVMKRCLLAVPWRFSKRHPSL